MKKKNWKIEVWNDQTGDKLFEKIITEQFKPMAMNIALNEFIFMIAINDLDEMDCLKFVTIEI
jgi:hypothetical protein